MKKYIVFASFLLISALLITPALGQEPSNTDNQTAIKVLIIVAQNGFRDEEYLKPRMILENAGAKITVASSSLNTASGMLGFRVMPDLTIDTVKVSDYQAIVFIGGIGAREYFNNKKAHQIAIEANNAGKIISAICIAPSILANAGILKDKRATAFPSEQLNLKLKGAKYTASLVEVDNNIITAKGPEAASEFGKTIAKILFNK